MDDPFSDITAEDDKPAGDPFGDITAPEPEQRGIIARTKEGFQGAYSPMLEGAADKLVDKEKHPYIHKATELAINANPLTWADKAMSAVMGATGAAAGAGAGVAEKAGLVNKAEADRLQRDFGIIGQGAMIEPGMGLAAARPPTALPHEVPHAAEPVAPTGGEGALREIVTGKPAPAPEAAPARAVPAPVYDAITGERVENLPDRAPEVPPDESSAPALAREVQGENAARTPPEHDPFADIPEEPPARVTERIPDEAQPAGAPEGEGLSNAGRLASNKFMLESIRKTIDDPFERRRNPAMVEHLESQIPSLEADITRLEGRTPEPAGAPVDSRPGMMTPPDPLDLAMSGQLTPERAKQIGQDVRRNQEEIENSIFGDKKTADEWRKLHRMSDRAWDKAEDAKARALDQQIEDLEARIGLTERDQNYLDGRDWPDHSDPQQWADLSRNLHDISMGREDALQIAASELRYLPAAGDWSKMAGSQRQSLITILTAMNEEVKAGRDPQAFLRDLAKARIQRYGGGPDAIEATKGQMEQLAGLVRSGIQREGPAPPEIGRAIADSRKKEKPPETMSQYIARNGGLELTPEARDMGLHKRFIPGAGNVARKSGKSLDGFWRERLMEAGYLDKDPDGYMSRDIRGELYDKLGGAEPTYSKFDRAPEPQMRGRDLEIETHAKSIVDAFEAEGLPKSELDTKVLYDAADRLYRGEAKDPFEAYDQAVMEEERNAQRGGVRGTGEEVHPPGGEGAGPRTEKAAAIDRSLKQSARPPKRVPRQEVSAADLAHLQETFTDKIGQGVRPLDSVRLRTALGELDLRHLRGASDTVARAVSERLSKAVGNTPVHFITDADMARYWKGKDSPAGVWVEQNKRSFVLINADIAADAGRATHVMLHEGTHAAAYRNIESNPALKRQLRSLMDEAEKYIQTESGRKHYGFTDEHEFLSEAFGNPSFQNALHATTAPARLIAELGGKGRIRTMWDAFVEMVRRTLGLPSATRTLLQAAIKVGEEATRAPERGKGIAEAAMKREEEPGAEGKPQLVLPGAERVTAAELAKRKVAERQAQEKMQAKKPQKAADEGLFGDAIKQMELSWLEPAKKPDQALIQREDVVRGPRSGRPLKSRKIPIGTEEAILEKGYEKATGEKGEPREPGIEPMLRDAGDELLSERLAVNNWGKLARISSALKFGKINAVEARVLMQDKFLRIKLIEDQWKRNHPGQQLPEQYSTYQAESLYYGRTGRRLEDFDKTHTDPLIRDIKKAGLTLEDVDDFLYARHAPERNAAVRKINPDIANPSGMSEAEAAAILKKADTSGKRATYDAIEKRVRKMVSETLDTLVADGLVAKDTADIWKSKYPNYVPLRGLEGVVEGVNHGKGYDIRGPESMRAMGRRSQADSPLSYVMSQAQQAIVRGERNRVGQVAGKFFGGNPQPGLWSVDKAPLKRIIDKKTGLVKEIENPTWRQQDNVFAYKVNGEPHYIRFEGEYGKNIARALKSLGTANMGKVMRFISTVTRTVARMSTTWNPEFMLGNFFRDAGEAFLNMRGEQKKGIARSFAKNIIPSIGGVYRGMKGKETGKYTELYHRFDKAGGRINFFGLETPEDIPANINAKLRRLNTRGLKSAALATKDAVLHGLEIANGAVENGTRLAAFKAGIEHGMTDKQAASFARELTVNFNRKGELGSTISGLYMFANAGIQGQARMMGAMRNKKVRRGAYALAGAGALTAIYNIANGGRDEDGKSKYSKIPPWERDTNMIFMWPDGSGRYSKLPLPYGYSFFKVMGERTAAMLYDNEDPKKAIGAILGSTLDAFDPLGRDQGIAHFAPTLTKPIINLATNTDAFGRPINRPPEPWNKHLPKSAPERASQSSSAFSKGVAEKLNEWTGGTPKIPGTVNMAPGDIDYGLGFATGGLGRFIMNSAAAGTRVYNGQEWQPEKTPVMRRFYGEKSDQADRALYFEDRDKAAAAFQQKNRGPDYDSANKFKATDKQRTIFRKQMDRIRADSELSPKEKDEQIKDLQDQELSHMLEARQFLERKRAESEGREPKFADGGTIDDDGDVNDMNSPAFKKAVTSALAASPDALAKRQEFYPNVKINSQAWDEHVKAMPESLNIEDRRPGYKGGLHQTVRRHYGYKQGGLA